MKEGSHSSDSADISIDASAWRERDHRWRATAILRYAVFTLLSVLALAVLLNWIPPLLALTVPLLVGLVALSIKFARDNRNLVEDATTRRFFFSSVSGFLRFIPAMVFLTAAFFLVWVFDYASEAVTDYIMQWAENEEVVSITEPKEVPRHFLSPLRLINSTKIIYEERKITKAHSTSIKFTVRTAVNFFEIITWYPWGVLIFITLRSYFYFWARSFLKYGGTVTMQFSEANKR